MSLPYDSTFNWGRACREAGQVDVKIRREIWHDIQYIVRKTDGEVYLYLDVAQIGLYTPSMGDMLAEDWIWVSPPNFS